MSGWRPRKVVLAVCAGHTGAVDVGAAAPRASRLLWRRGWCWQLYSDGVGGFVLLVCCCEVEAAVYDDGQQAVSAFEVWYLHLRQSVPYLLLP